MNTRRKGFSRDFLQFSVKALFLVLLWTTTTILSTRVEAANAERYKPESLVEGSGWADIYDPVTNSTRSLPYTIIDGMAIYQGDMILGPAGSFVASPAPDNPLIQQGVATRSLGRRWTDGIVYYDLNSHPQSTAILNAMDYLEDNTSIRFIARASEPDYVIFGSTGGCSSFIGQIGGGQNISIGPGCQSRGVVSHEIFHALGVYHEQSRSDRDSFVTINFGNITAGFEGNFNKAGNAEDIGSYDYSSIMHYGNSFFSNGGGNTITTTPPGISIGNRSALSTGDIETMQYLYYTDLQLDLTTVSQVNPGADVQLTIDIANRGDATIGDIIAKDVKVTLPLPAQSSYVGFVSADSWACSQISQTIECTIATLERNADSQITIDLSAPTSLNNMIITPVVSASNRDIQAANDSDSATVTILSLTDLGVTLNTSSNSVNVGESVTMNLMLDNSGMVDAQQVSLVLITPVELEYSGFIGNGWSCTQAMQTTTCSLASLAISATSSLDLEFKATDGLNGANIIATVSTQNTDGDLSNNSRNASIDLINLTDLGVSLTTANSGVREGDDVTIDLSVSNNSPQTVDNITVNLTAPSNFLEFREASGTGWNCNVSGSTIVCGLKNLAASTLSQLAVKFKTLAVSDSVNISAVIMSQLSDVNSANNSASTSLKIDAVAATNSTSSSSSGGGGLDLYLMLLMSIFASLRFFKYNRSL